jgi:hypothetical protein
MMINNCLLVFKLSRLKLECAMRIRTYIRQLIGCGCGMAKSSGNKYVEGTVGYGEEVTGYSRICLTILEAPIQCFDTAFWFKIIQSMTPVSSV